MNKELEVKFIEIQDEIQRALEKYHFSEKKARINELEALVAADGFWDDASKAQKIAQELGQTKAHFEKWLRFQNSFQTCLDLWTEKDPEIQELLEQEIHELLANYESLRIELYLNGPYDHYSAIMSIHAGTGGTDAMDFAEMLLRMYLRFVDRKEWTSELLEKTVGPEAGIKSVSIKISGEFVYGLMKHEGGVHRLVRLSPFNAGETRETSFAMVEVLPDLEKVELDIKEEDLQWDVFRSGGSGGQSVNTTDSAVRLTHKPSGLVVTCQNERSQLQNKMQALQTLKAKLIALTEKHHLETIQEIKGDHIQMSWGNQIRSYVLHPYQMVKDHRTSEETSQIQQVLDGDIENFIKASLFKKD